VLNTWRESAGRENLVIGGFVQRDARSLHGLRRAHRIALAAGNLNESADEVARHPKVVFHGNLGRVLHLSVAPTQRSRQSGGGHRIRHTHLALATNHRAAN
jgi:hypothetical protein